MTRLSAQQLMDWDRDGFLVVRRFVAPDELEMIRSRIDGLAAEEPPHPAIDIELDQGLQDDEARPRPQRMRALMHAAHADPVLRDGYTLREKTVDVVSDLLGPDVVFYTDQTFLKPPGGSAIPAHQDNAYWNRFWVGDDKLSVWLALDDSTLDNGCTVFVPGTHKRTIEHDDVEDRVFGKKITVTAEQRAREVPVELEAGDCCIHHGWVVHYSGANESRRPRRGHVSIYFSARTRYGDEKSEFFRHDFIPARGATFPDCVG